MINYGNISSKDYLQAFKLSNIHRRVYPLSLFSGRSSESPQSLLKIQSFEYSRKFSEKTQEKKVKTKLRPLRSCKKTGNEQKLPELNYKSIRKLRDNKGFARKFRNISKDFGRDFKGYERVKRQFESLDGKNMLGVLSNGEKCKKKSVCEMLEEMKTEPKVRRISSSKITYPSANYGQILDKIKDLVIDPLKLELGD